MSDVDESSVAVSYSPVGNGTSDSPGFATQTLSAGGMLRHFREEAGLHIGALAVSLKVPVRKLEALEADRFDLLPDMVFVRALASSVCRTLKVDPAVVLDRLPQTDRPKLIYQGAGINTPFRVPHDKPGPSVWTQASRPALICGALLLAGALGLIFLPSLKAMVSEAKLASAAAAVEDAVAAGAVSSASQDTRQDSGNPVQSGEASSSAIERPAPLTSGPAADVSKPLTLALAKPMTTTERAPVAAPLMAASAISPIASPALTSTPSLADLVLFNAKGESWVEVTDSKGQVVLRRTLAAGEVVGVSGVLPLTAVVGRADAVAVRVRGRTLDLDSFSRNNVARFEVK